MLLDSFDLFQLGLHPSAPTFAFLLLEKKMHGFILFCKGWFCCNMRSRAMCHSESIRCICLIPCCHYCLFCVFFESDKSHLSLFLIFCTQVVEAPLKRLGFDFSAPSCRRAAMNGRQWCIIKKRRG